MKVKPADINRVLGLGPSTAHMARDRGKLHNTVDGLIDLEDEVNHAWIVQRLIKQGCEVPEDIKFLFLATPITESKKSDKDSPSPAHANAGVKSKTLSDAEPATPPPDPERERAAREIAATSRTYEKAKADSMVAKAEQEKLKAAELRRELIRISPLSRLLFNIKAAERIQVANLFPNLNPKILDDIESALKAKSPRTEILMKMQEQQKAELSKIYKSIDTEIKNKLRQIKSKGHIVEPDDSEAIDVGA